MLLTGATGKFGRKLFDSYISAGWKVVAISSNETRLESLLRDARDSDLADGIVSDLMLPGASRDVVISALERGHRISHLINAARSMDSLGQEPDGTSQGSNFVAEYIMDVVVPYELSTSLAMLQPSELESIVNISSQYGIVASNPSLYGGQENAPIQYACAKAAVVQLTKELAVRLANQNVRVNCVAFGGVEGRVDEEFKAKYSRLVPSGRMLSEPEIVGPIQFLTSDASSAVTGHTLVADGGWTIW